MVFAKGTHNVKCLAVIDKRVGNATSSFHNATKQPNATSLFPRNKNNDHSMDSMDPNATETQTGESLLKSLPHFDNLRLNATGNITREKGSNSDVFQDPDTEEDVVLCHLNTLFPLSISGNFLWAPMHVDAVAVALAAHHLNVGDGRFVSEVEGLNERCNVRFTVEFADTQLDTEYALNQVVDRIGRSVGEADRLPCAFVGTLISKVAVPTSIVTGLFGYPQVSATATSADLDDRSQHPLFGRTMPNDADNAVPFILYLRDALNVTKLAVVHVNDPYGNANVLGLREAARKYSPDMDIRSIPINEEKEGTEKEAIEAVKETGYRYVFCAVYQTDKLMTEAYNMDVAGNGKHNWFFGDSTSNPSGGTYEKGSPLSLAYRGVGKLQFTGGLPGMPAYDSFTNEMEKLKNPDDLQYLGSLFSKNGNIPPFVEDGSFVSSPLSLNYATLNYEAAIALGLSACSAVSSNGFLDGDTHFKRFTETSFTGVSGSLSFNNITGTRDVTGTTYKLTNFLPSDVVDDETGETLVGFTPYITDVFKHGEWEEVRDFVFNDGTVNVPPDGPPPQVEEEGLQWTHTILAPVVIALVAAIGILFVFERKRRQTDALWYIKKEELKFADPPEIIGRGGFGLILKAEYRGTDVAVKRVLPPRQGEGGWKTKGSTDSGSLDSSEGPQTKTPNTGKQHLGLRSVADKGSITQTASSTSGLRHTTTGAGGMATVAIVSLEISRSQLRKDFIKEMRVLSKLRHSCIATVMGAVLERGSEPMLIMEYMDHGSLYDVLHNETMHIESNLLLHILQDVSQGLRFLHSSIPQVVHCDIKSVRIEEFGEISSASVYSSPPLDLLVKANVLVDSRFRAKVADFGLSHDKYVNGVTGTAYWMAPELLRGESGNTTASDVYAFGIVLYEIYSRRDPYDGEDSAAVLHLVADKLVQKRPPVPQNMPAQIQSLMQDCIQDDASLRPSFQEIDLRLKRMDIDEVRTISDDPKRAATNAAASMSLFDIFPRHIAEALRDGRAVEPEHRDMVTIFFSDIVGFTQLSAELPPRKVALLLNRLYTKLDALSRKHDVFKVETIGDAYMAVTNLVKKQEKDHAKRIAEFAIDAVREANETLVDEEDPLKGYLNVRVGFHSGSVVADVVGTRNLRYCLFGDSVNIASRMESSSKPNRIHCSLASAEILAKQCPSLPVKSRGLIAIKGKGEMHTCWVNEGIGSPMSKLKDAASSMVHWAKGQRPSLADTHSIEEGSTTSGSDAKL
eukprot:scaffold10066_cov100-Cylindrotheca_fusiformis.AAC.5